MFGKLFKKTLTVGKVYIINFHVKPMENTIMPSELGGAYVTCFSMGSDYKEAIKNCVQKLLVDGIDAIDVQGSVREIEAREWSKHIANAWPEFKDNLSSQSEFEGKVVSGGVEYGPFIGYNHQSK